MEEKGGHKDDLPLMANSDELLVRHYVLDWKFDLERKVVEGTVIVILDPLVDKEYQPSSSEVFGRVSPVDPTSSGPLTDLQNTERDVYDAETKHPPILVRPGHVSRCLEQVDTSDQKKRYPNQGDQLSAGADDCRGLGKSCESCITPSSSEGCHSSAPTCTNSPIDGSPETERPKRNEALMPVPAVDVTSSTGKSSLKTDTTDRRDANVNPSSAYSTNLPGQHRDLVCNKLGICSCGVKLAKQSENFHFVLDCCDLLVDSVEEVILPMTSYSVIFSDSEQNSDVLYDEYLKCRTFPCCNLDFLVEKWCLRIWKEGVTDVGRFPRVVSIKYQTRPSGASLWWIKDQDGYPCVFTPAAWINNRALFPCQEPPLALASWQAHVTVQQGLVVLMSGDKEPVVTCDEGSESVFYYFTKMPHPAAVLAIAVGSWKSRPLVEGKAFSGCSKSLIEICSHQPRCKISYTDQQTLPSRLYAPESLLDKAYAEFKDYIIASFEAAYDTLGPHPFPRLDVLIIPRSFASLGLANPSLMFLSQSLISGDGSSCIRISHELSHSWFGILIGARDWTEEWLSEGFATYMEDIIHAKVMKWNAAEAQCHAELRAMIRYRVLCAEIENTEEGLQSLRPSQGKETRDPDTSVLYVKNGMNPDKRFTQVHYLKGYFLLRHLASLLGEVPLNSFIRRYATEFHGRSVLSQELFSLMFEVFPELSEKGITMSMIYEDWLDNPGMPKDLKAFQPSAANQLYKEVINVVEKWRSYNQTYIKYRKSPKKLKRIDTNDLKEIKLVPEQLVLVLEFLLEESKISRVTLQQLDEAYNPRNCNADIQHRWCELVVKHSYNPGYRDVRDFLINHQAMGIYLYGELVLSGSRIQRQIAEDVFQELKEEMEKDTYITVREMLFGESRDKMKKEEETAPVE